MSTLRFHAIKESLKRKPIVIEEKQRRSEIFGSHVFNESTMRQYLTKEGFEIAKTGWFTYLELVRLKKEDILKQQKIDTDKATIRDRQEETIRLETINKFRYDKFSFWFSILAIVISLLSLLWK